MRKEPDDCYIYAISTEGGPTKIGHAQCVDARVTQLQYKVGQKLIATGKWPIGRARALAAERYVHWLLRDKHYRGEWFNASLAEIEEAVSTALKQNFDPYNLIPPVDSYGREATYPEHFKVRLATGTTIAIAAACVDGEGSSSFIREAIDREIRRREKLKPKDLK